MYLPVFPYKTQDKTEKRCLFQNLLGSATVLLAVRVVAGRKSRGHPSINPGVVMLFTRTDI